MSEQPNLIERIENLIASLDEAEIKVEGLDIDGDSAEAIGHIDNARGIAGELLTMIDGR